MPPTRVGVIGAGMAGPVLALFLKAKGYDPVVFERNDFPSDAGLSIAIARNGAQVLAKIPGLFECLRAAGCEIDTWDTYSMVEEDKGLLGTSNQPKRMRGRYGFGMLIIRRSLMQMKLIEMVEKAGVRVLWGHKLETVAQGEDSVTVAFANGVKEKFSFVVGCDGLHSNTRICLFGEQPASYTGFTQCGGFAPRPKFIDEKNVAADIYGNGCSMILLPVDASSVIWAVTQKEPESKETWKAIDTASAEVLKNSQLGKWDFGCGEAVKNSRYVTRYGLYDRPELKCWHQRRVVLIGDAAHPTSPFIGQGANQSFEDIDALIHLLEKHNPSAATPSTTVLETVFQELEGIRIPRSSEMVKRARKQGESRVVEGVEACIARNNEYREMFQSGQFFKRRFGVDPNEVRQ